MNERMATAERSDKCRISRVKEKLTETSLNGQVKGFIPATARSPVRVLNATGGKEAYSFFTSTHHLALTAAVKILSWINLSLIVFPFHKIKELSHWNLCTSELSNESSQHSKAACWF